MLVLSVFSGRTATPINLNPSIYALCFAVISSSQAIWGQDTSGLIIIIIIIIIINTLLVNVTYNLNVWLKEGEVDGSLVVATYFNFVGFCDPGTMSVSSIWGLRT